MYYADEVRDFAAVEKEDAPVKEKEIKLAEMLIDELTEKKFNPLQYKDQYRERLLDRIRDKSKGKSIVSDEKEEDEKGAEVIDIMEALRRSLEGGRASAKRAPAAAKRSASAGSRKTTQSRKRRAS
jgi:DNA end-binding protein Ku